MSRNRTAVSRKDRLAEVMKEQALAKRAAERLRKKRTLLWRKNRERAIVRDNHTCRMCPFDLCLDVHHVVPLAEGGSDRLDNLITLCPNHHVMAHKGLILPKEFARCLARRKPHGRFVELCEIIGEVCEALTTTESDPGKLAEAYRTLRAELPSRLSVIYGTKVVTANFERTFRKSLAL